MLYFARQYNPNLNDVPVSDFAAYEAMFVAWSEADPVDEVERLRHAGIEAEQGNTNPFVQCDVLLPELLP